MQLSFETQVVAIVNYLQLHIKFKEEFSRNQKYTLLLPPQIGQLYLRKDLAETKVSGLSPTLLACNTHHWSSTGRTAWSEKSPAKQIEVLNHKVINTSQN